MQRSKTTEYLEAACISTRLERVNNPTLQLIKWMLSVFRAVNEKKPDPFESGFSK